MQYDQADWHDPAVIYAISVSNYDQLTLVKEEKMIGIMTPTGDTPQPYLKSKKKPAPQKNKYKEKHTEDECPIHLDAEYNVEEIADLDLLELSAPIDRFLADAAEKVAYEAD